MRFRMQPDHSPRRFARLLRLVLWGALGPSVSWAQPVPVPASQAVGPPRRDSGDGFCATLIHERPPPGSSAFTSVDQAAAQISLEKGQGQVDDKLARIFTSFNFRNADAGAVGDFGAGGKALFPFSDDAQAAPQGDNRNFALRARGYLSVPRAGIVTLAVNAYDGHRLRVGGAVVTESEARISARVTRQVKFQAPGLYPLELVYYHNGSVAILEVSQADSAEFEGQPLGLDTNRYRLWPTARLFSARVDRSPACIECGVDRDCAPPTFCGDGLCQACNTADHCGPTCAACTAARPLCAAGRCVECAADADCPPGLVCEAGQGVCQGGVPCRTSDECPRDRVCDTSGGVCITPPTACTDDAQCKTGQDCDKLHGVCVATPTACSADDGCPPSQLCDPDRRVCRARLRGRYVGGCDISGAGPGGAGPGGAGWAGLGALALGLLWLGRRRRLRGGRRAAGALGLLISACGLLSGAEARAQLSANAQTFHPALGPDNVITVEGTRTPGTLQPMFNGVLEFAYRPLRLIDPATGETLATTVPHMTALHVQAGMGLVSWLSVGLDLPLVLYQGFDRRTPVLDVRDEPSSFGIGDLRMVAKFRLLDNAQRSGLGLALVPQVTFPTGSGAALRGDDAFGIEPRAAVDYRFAGGAFVAANLGLLFRTSDQLVRDVRVTHQVRYGLGGYLPIVAGLGVAGELTGGVALGTGPAGSPLYAPTELYLGARWVHRTGLNLNLGGGSGITAAPGSAPVRLFAGIGYLPVGAPRRPVPADPDPDHDGLLGSADQCPTRAGPPENFGCPDKDSDRDGLVDRLDRCPHQPGPPANTGCPDADSDGDGVPDRLDDCPQQPGLRDNRGCPDRDLDGDGVPDRLDRCAADPGPAPSGCPVRRYIAVQVDKIELLYKILFATDRARLSPASYPLLDEIADVLRRRPTLELAIEGHTDSTGGLRHNMSLSESRAAAVREYLLHAGIDGRRLLARGFGPTRPAASNGTPAGRERNRRTEFVVTHQ